VLVFEWDPEKASRNKKKHGVPFPESATVFGDLLSLTIPDPEHSVGESRYLIVGASFRGRILVVSHMERGDRVRIVSARRATLAERRKYEEE
jgi:uncharacterized DUF497 family protein